MAEIIRPEVRARFDALTDAQRVKMLGLLLRETIERLGLIAIRAGNDGVEHSIIATILADLASPECERTGILSEKLVQTRPWSAPLYNELAERMLEKALDPHPPVAL